MDGIQGNPNYRNFGTLPNIVEFVKSDPNRYGILFVHPWSINGTDIANYSKQVHYCPEWKSVVRAIHDIDGTKESARRI
jgi:hypothetical protein